MIKCPFSGWAEYIEVEKSLEDGCRGLVAAESLLEGREELVVLEVVEAALELLPLEFARKRELD